MTATELASAFSTLSAKEKLKLIELLWDSLTDTEKQWELSPAQQKLLQERIAAYKANPKEGRPWPEVKAKILGKKR